MKKTFKLIEDHRHPDRTLEAVKHEVRKYLKRERNKKLPEGATFWDFECQFGQDDKHTKALKQSELTAALDEAAKAQWPSCYIQIIAKPVTK